MKPTQAIPPAEFDPALAEQEALWLWCELADQRKIAQDLTLQLEATRQTILDLRQQLESHQPAPQQPQKVSAAPAPGPILNLLGRARKTATQLAEYPGYVGLLFELAGEAAELSKHARGQSALKSFYKLSSLLEALVAELWKNPELVSDQVLQTIQEALDAMEWMLSNPVTSSGYTVSAMVACPELVGQLRAALSLLEPEAQLQENPEPVMLEESDLLLTENPELLGSARALLITKSASPIELALRIQITLLRKSGSA